MSDQKDILKDLPQNARDFINLVIKKMRYRKKIKMEVKQELADHFEDALKDYPTDEERYDAARKMIEDFGDPAILGKLLKRAKKRCRPLWRTIVARTFQTIGIIIIAFILYSIWFITGEANIRIDYLSRLNNISKPDIKAEDNAWTYYKKAIDLYVPDPNEYKFYVWDQNIPKTIKWIDITLNGFNQLDKNKQQYIKDYLNKNQPAFDQYIKASQKLYFYKKYSTEMDGIEKKESKDEFENCLFSVLLPNLSDIRSLTRALKLNIQLVGCDNFNQSIEEIIAILNTGKHHQYKKLIIEQLVGISILKEGLNELQTKIQNCQISSDELTKIQEELSNLYQQDFPGIFLEGERMSMMDIIQRIFTDSGIGGGHMVPERVADMHITFAFYGHNGVQYKLLKPKAFALSMIHARRDATVKMYNKLYDNVEMRAKFTPYEKHINNIPDEAELLFEEDIECLKYYLISKFFPALNRVIDRNYKAMCEYQSTITAVAIKCFELDKGKLPDSLDELLKTGYIDNIPNDPFGPGDISYIKTDIGFTLYSFGPDFDDDKGKIFDEGGRKNRPRDIEDDGDLILYPPIE